MLCVGLVNRASLEWKGQRFVSTFCKIDRRHTGTVPFNGRPGEIRKRMAKRTCVLLYNNMQQSRSGYPTHSTMRTYARDQSPMSQRHSNVLCSLRFVNENDCFILHTMDIQSNRLIFFWAGFFLCCLPRSTGNVISTRYTYIV